MNQRTECQTVLETNVSHTNNQQSSPKQYRKPQIADFAPGLHSALTKQYNCPNVQLVLPPGELSKHNVVLDSAQWPHGMKT